MPAAKSPVFNLRAFTVTTLTLPSEKTPLTIYMSDHVSSCQTTQAQSSSRLVFGMHYTLECAPYGKLA